jgi:hypothetical protein
MKRLLHQIIVSQIWQNLQTLLYSYPSSSLVQCEHFYRGRVHQSYRALPEENQPGSKILLELDDNWFAIFQFLFCFLKHVGCVLGLHPWPKQLSGSSTLIG